MQGLPPIALRGMRVEQAVALQEPDRVPFIPTWNNFYQLEYGVSFGESMRDPFTLNGIREYRFGDPFNSVNFKATKYPDYVDPDAVKKEED